MFFIQKKSDQAAKEITRIENIIGDVDDLTYLFKDINRSVDDEWEGKAALAFKDAVVDISSDLNRLRMELTDLKNKISLLRNEFMAEEENDKEDDKGII